MKLGEKIEGTRLTPIRFAFSKGHAAYYRFRCDCGNEKDIRKKNVGSDYRKTKSCGCLRRERCKALMGANQFQPGRTPWNKGLKNPYDPGSPRKTTKGRPAWNKGHIKVKYPNGTFQYVKVSNKSIGSDNKWSKF